MHNIKNIRNFSIIAHIDHGKSTLADRMLEFSGALSSREMKDQVLDSMEIERERGITIKAQTVRLEYKNEEGEEYIFNLIDTPGHVDFTYEVSRSLSACEGALLVIDASQGLEAQTLANLYLALEHNIEIIPVINKIDLPNADPEGVKQQIKEVLGMDPSSAILASAKAGIGIKEIFDSIIHLIPPPKGEKNAPLKALLLDSWYNTYHGVVNLIRMYDGEIKKDMDIRFMSTGRDYLVDEIGIFTPKYKAVERLLPGEVGVINCNIKKIIESTIGDTITDHRNPTKTPLPGHKEPKPVIFSGLYPTDSEQYAELKDALAKLLLNDSSFIFTPETSAALGFGFRCGFLGLLHMEIIKERLEREFSLELIITAPTVIYKVKKRSGEIIMIDTPSDLPPVNDIEYMEEPYIKGIIITPDEFLGNIITLAQQKRGIQKDIEYLTTKKVMLTYEFPFNEILMDFYDKLKSVSKGYASFDYEHIDYRPSELVKLDVLINGESVDALSIIIFKEKSYYTGRELIKKMKEVIPRQMFEVIIQASIGSRIIARETVKAMRKDVISKCYGGDITRKRKLLEKQKEGKKRMKQVGKVDLPQEVFLSVLKID